MHARKTQLVAEWLPKLFKQRTTALKAAVKDEQAMLAAVRQLYEDAAEQHASAAKDTSDE